LFIVLRVHCVFSIAWHRMAWHGIASDFENFDQVIIGDGREGRLLRPVWWDAVMLPGTKGESTDT